jgi:hypothetical protein
LRGSFRIPLGLGGVTTLAVLPMVILLVVVAMSFIGGENGVLSLVETAIGVSLGPLGYWLAVRRRGSTARVSASTTG